MIVRVFFFLSLRRTPRSTRTDILFPFTSLFRSAFLSWLGAGVAPQLPPSQSEPTIAYRPAFSVHPAHMGRAQSGPMVQSLCAVPDCEALFDTGGPGPDLVRSPLTNTSPFYTQPLERFNAALPPVPPSFPHSCPYLDCVGLYFLS